MNISKEELAETIYNGWRKNSDFTKYTFQNLTRPLQKKFVAAAEEVINLFSKDENIKPGDTVYRNEEYAKDPENIACNRMTIHTPYVVEAITPGGLLVLKGYLMLVHPKFVIKA